MIWFSSDQHFYHTNVIKYCNRPYKTVEEMNEALVHNWNQVVGQDDEVYVIGDFSMAFRSVELFTHRLLGTKHLICGNHDFCHPTHKKSRSPENRQKWIDKYIECGWDSVRVEHKMILKNGVEVKLCHLPYHDPSSTYDDGRFTRHRPADEGHPLLCGHVHEKWKTKHVGESVSMTPGCRAAGSGMVNVGVDVWDMKPVSEDQIIALMEVV